MITLLLMVMPLAGIIIWLLRDAEKAALIAFVGSTIGLVISLVMLVSFDSTLEGFQFIEKADWIADLGINYHVGIDGISLFFLPLTNLLFMGIIASSWKYIRTLRSLYYSLLLLLEMASMGVFVALDTIFFFLFWELTLIPVYFLVALWGKGPKRRYVATKYTLMMMVGGIPILFGFILLATSGEGGNTVFDYQILINTRLAMNTQTLVFFLLVIGFAFKTALFPLHTWLPVIVMQGPIAVAIAMTGMKLGAYGIIRYAIPLAPDAAVDYHWFIALIGTVSIIYGALLALQQTNIRSMLAYASISHVGLLVVALASFDVQGIEGAVFQLINFMLVSGGLFLLLGFIYQRIGSTEINDLGGLATKMPLMAAFFLFFGLAGMGMPGTSGFPAELMMLVSTLTHHTGAGLVVLLAVVLEAAYFLGMVKKTMFGPVHNPVIAESVDLTKRELGIIIGFALLILVLGLYPPLLLDQIETSTLNWVAHVKGL